MVSIKTSGENIEARQFMDDEHQITIGIDSDLWPLIQEIANATAKRKEWLFGQGSNCDNLNIWIIGRISSCPTRIEPWRWIEMATVGE